MRRLLSNKRGAAHFEMIFSIVFFMGFVFFLFMVLKPQDTSTLSGSVIEALYDSFEAQVYTNMSTMFLKAEKVGGWTGSEICFEIELPGEIFAYPISDGNSYVTTMAGTSVDSGLRVDNSLNINKDENYFRVAISPEFEDKGTDICELLLTYDLGTVLERRVVSYTALEDMYKSYTLGGYEALRDSLRVPPIFDFAITPETLKLVSMEPKNGIPDSVEVRAQDYVVEVLRPNGTLINERFTLKIW